MNDVTAHYERLLAPAYTWMLGGDIGSLTEGQLALFAEAGLDQVPGRDLAIDLGAGSGAGALALAALGFRRVLAVDTSSTLLAELSDHAAAVPEVEPVHADLRAIAEFTRPGTVDVLVCLGDTLTHLRHRGDVDTLLVQAVDALRPGGRLLITYRDLSGPPDDPGRFLLVRGDDDRVLTCYLEPRSVDVVLVHDLLHRRGPDGWTLETSSYPKLRLPAPWLLDRAEGAGLVVRSCRSTDSGLIVIDLERP